jgi:hypothetical protein
VSAVTTSFKLDELLKSYDHPLPLGTWNSYWVGWISVPSPEIDWLMETFPGQLAVWHWCVYFNDEVEGENSVPLEVYALERSNSVHPHPDLRS